MSKKDEDGNIVGCSYCGARDIKKDGWEYKAKGKKKQRWQCLACGKKQLNPTIVVKSPFEAETKKVEFVPIEEIIAHRNKQYNQKLSSKKSRNLINIKINQMGPIGILHFGDPHVDDDGTNLAEIYSLCNLVNKTDGLFGVILEIFKTIG